MLDWNSSLIWALILLILNILQIRRRENKQTGMFWVQWVESTDLSRCPGSCQTAWAQSPWSNRRKRRSSACTSTGWCSAGCSWLFLVGTLTNSCSSTLLGHSTTSLLQLPYIKLKKGKDKKHSWDRLFTVIMIKALALRAWNMETFGK